MRILLTNNTLADRAGSELYIRDLALALRRRGHEPVAYSPHLGDVADDLRESTVAVTSDVRSIRVPPDVIHGQHHLEAMTALAQFPGVPAIFVCHGWLPWQECPPRHPRIGRYVAVDSTVLDRLVLESGIEPGVTRLLPNFVDTRRFVQREPLPPRALRALVFNSQATEENFGVIVREACATRGIGVDLAGYASGTPVRAPERLLASYELVFARGRSALEAIATGCATIVADPSGVAGLVTSENVDVFRRLNFGIRTFAAPSSVDALRAAIGAYDPFDAARVSERIRAESDIEAVVDAYEELYECVRREHVARSIDPAIEREAFVEYLRWLSLQTKMPGFTDWNVLKQRYDAALLDAAALRSRLRAFERRSSVKLDESAAGVLFEQTTTPREVELERELQSVKADASEMERRFRADITSLRQRFDRLYGVRFLVRAAAWIRRFGRGSSR